MSCSRRGTSCTIFVTFSPAAAGTPTGNVTITGDSPVTGSPVPLSANAAILADLSITKVDGVSSVVQGGSVSYTIVVTNIGPSPITGAVVTDNRIATYLSAWNWSCAPVASCGGSAGSNTNQTGNINKTLATLASGASVTFTVTGQVSSTATTGANTATVGVGSSGATDPNPANNSATDTNTIVVPSVKFTGESGPGTLTGTTLDFGNIGGSTTQTNTLTLTITGASVTFGAPTVSGAAYGLGGTNTCVGTLGPGSCSISITFNPSGGNTKNGTLTVPYTGGVAVWPSST